MDTGDAQYHMAEVKKVAWNEIGALFNIIGKYFYFCFDIYLVQAKKTLS